MSHVNGFFRAGMGTRIKNNWRYKRQEMGGFIFKYQAISIPAFDIERIQAEEGLENILVEEKATGSKFYAPVDSIEQGMHMNMRTWKEPEQLFIPIECWTQVRKGERRLKKSTLPDMRKHSPEIRQTSFFGG